ncbi:hypothetical protein A7X88_02820 [Stenotrophomonas maltophilia]|nr:hypothetical protein A7X88_02820 [Stenotrophomonas maltophilia]
MGCLVTFDGAGDGFGQASGIAGGEVVAQLETASAQVSHNSSRDGRGRSAVFFMLRSNGGQFLGLGVLGGTGMVDLLHQGGTGSGLLTGFGALSAIAAPDPTSTEHCA